MAQPDIEPGQTWEIDRLRPEDAEGVRRLFRSVYGDGYPIRTFVDPERLIAENRAARTISSVARTPGGDIVGHNAIYHSAPSDQIFESGAGLVHRRYRGGKGIFRELILHGQKIAAEECRAAAIWGEAVCNHLFSQRAGHSLGWPALAVEVDLMPAAAYTTEGSADGRVSTLMTFCELHPRPQNVWVPGVYAERLQLLYQNLPAPRAAAVSLARPADLVATRIEAQAFAFARVARLTVRETGADFEVAFQDTERTVRGQGVEVLQAWLPLSDPAVGWAADRLRAEGYFFGGLLPRWFDGDGLLMQKTIRPPCWDRIQTALDWNRTVVNMARSDWEALAP